eukprot:6203687-Pleurochrysis_carterae.AAC.2
MELKAEEASPSWSYSIASADDMTCPLRTGFSYAGACKFSVKHAQSLGLHSRANACCEDESPPTSFY